MCKFKLRSHGFYHKACLCNYIISGLKPVHLSFSVFAKHEEAAFSVLVEGHLCLRCTKSLNLRFGRTKFSCYDYGAAFSIFMRRNIYTFVYKTVWLI